MESGAHSRRRSGYKRLREELRFVDEQLQGPRHVADEFKGQVDVLEPNEVPDVADRRDVPSKGAAK